MQRYGQPPKELVGGGVSIFTNNESDIVKEPAFPQLMEISIKMAITSEGGVLINCIYFTIFSKVLCLPFCQIPSPYQDSHVRIICGNFERSPVTAETGGGAIGL